MLGCAALALYAPLLRNGLTNWDDAEYITESRIATQGLRGVAAADFDSDGRPDFAVASVDLNEVAIYL